MILIVSKMNESGQSNALCILYFQLKEVYILWTS